MLSDEIINMFPWSKLCIDFHKKYNGISQLLWSGKWKTMLHLIINQMLIIAPLNKNMKFSSVWDFAYMKVNKKGKYMLFANL